MLFRKLIRGEFSLAKTLWVYGILGVVSLTIIAIISEQMLYDKIGNIKAVEHYVKSVNFMALDAGIIAVAVFNISSMLVLLFYSLNMLLAVWRSSIKNNKKKWLAYISRFLMFLVVFVCLYVTL